MRRFHPWLTASSLAVLVLWLQANFFYAYGIDTSWSGWPFDAVGTGVSGTPYVNVIALVVDIGILSVLSFVACRVANKAGARLRWLSWILWRGGIAVRFVAVLVTIYFIIGITLGRRVSEGAYMRGGRASSPATFEAGQRSFTVEATLFPSRPFHIPGLFSFTGTGALALQLSMKADFDPAKITVHSCRLEDDHTAETNHQDEAEYNLPHGPIRFGKYTYTSSSFSTGTQAGEWWSFHQDSVGLPADYLNGRSKMNVVLDMEVATSSTTQRFSDVVSLNVEEPSTSCAPYWSVHWL